MTSEDVEEFCMISMLPVFMDEARKLIAEHNADPDAHPAILNQISTVDSRLSLLELMYNTDVSGKPQGKAERRCRGMYGSPGFLMNCLIW